MGGSSGGGSKKVKAPKAGPAPPQAQPIDYGAMMAAASAAAERQVEAQFQNMVKYYPDMERQQIGTVQNLGSLLSEEGGKLFTWTKVPAKGRTPESWKKIEIGEADPNKFTGDARRAVEAAMAQRGPVEVQADALAEIGEYISDRARESYEGSGATWIESELYRQAENELGAGRALTPEQERAAQQSARAALGARGMGLSQAAVATEVLNRDAYGAQREAERRNFAGATNQMVMGNIMARRDQAAQQAALGANVRGNAAQVYGQSAGIGMTGANQLVGIDPIQRGMAPGIGLGSSIQGTSGQMIGNTYASANQMAGNVASFNANMLDSRYNSWANNQAALQGAAMYGNATLGAARIQAGATQSAGMMGMIGGLGGGALSGLGSVGGGFLR